MMTPMLHNTLPVMNNHDDTSSYRYVPTEKILAGLREIRKNLQYGGPEVSTERILSYLKDVRLEKEDSAAVEELVLTYRSWFMAMMHHL